MAHVDPPEGSKFALHGFLGSSTGANRSGGPRSSVGHPEVCAITVWICTTRQLDASRIATTSTDPCAARGDATSSSDAMLNHWRAVRGIDCLLVIGPGWHVSWSLVCLITQPNREPPTADLVRRPLLRLVLIRSQMPQVSRCPDTSLLYRVPDGSLRYGGMVSRGKRSPYLMVAGDEAERSDDQSFGGQ